MKRASDNLVKAAQKAAFEAEDDQAVVVKSKMVGGIAQVSALNQDKLHNSIWLVCNARQSLMRLDIPLQIIAAQEEMLRKERELVEARKKLAMIRQQQYKFLPSELREDGQDQWESFGISNATVIQGTLLWAEKLNVLQQKHQSDASRWSKLKD